MGGFIVIGIVIVTWTAISSKLRTYLPSNTQLNYQHIIEHEKYPLPSNTQLNYQHIIEHEKYPSSHSNSLLFETHSSPVSALGLAAPEPFQFYVYDSLPGQYGVQNISTCVEKRFARDSVCGWGPQICVEPKKSNPRYVSWRHNGNADVALVDLFQRYPYPKDYGSSASAYTPATGAFALRTDVANEADLFVVPYAHDSHCKCVVGHTWCARRVDKKGLMDAHLDIIFGSLRYYNETTASRHLFISSTCFPFAHPRIKKLPVRTTIGDLRTAECIRPNSLCGSVVIPYMNTVPEYQPPRLIQRTEEWWTRRKRNYSLVAINGMLGEGREVKSDRNEFFRRKDELLGAEIGGLPVHVQVLGRQRALQKEQDVLDLYQNATFCMILPGDGPAQKRFFDAIMSGCIPVVISFPATTDPGSPAWWKNSYVNQTLSIRVSYPFPKGFFAGSRGLGIDYPSLVVETCGLECIKPTLERVIANETELLRLRQNLRRHASLFSYGLEANSHRFFDAFALVLTQLGHYLQRLTRRER